MTNLPSARILAIETSCDETACAVIENGRALLASTVASQMEMHARYGGVYPEVASRQHVLSIVPVVEQTLAQSNIALKDIDAIAVTRGPGLAGSLVVGMNMAKGLALGTNLPIIGVNHLEGHIYSSWIHNAGESIPRRTAISIDGIARLRRTHRTESHDRSFDVRTSRLHPGRCGW